MFLKQSTARNRMVLMVDSADHVTGKTGLTLTITASKNGAAFAGIAPTVTERGDGWYSVALTSAHTDTLGDLALHITGGGADPTDIVDQVTALLPGEAVNLGSILGTAITESGSGQLADAFTTLFDVAAPVLTAESANQSGDAYGRLGAPAGASIAADIAALPSATEAADAVLGRDLSAVSSPASRSLLEAVRLLRNRWTVAAGVLTVYEEDGTTVAWTTNVSEDAAADPITGSAPA